jgi:Uma2 family endonuclease
VGMAVSVPRYTVDDLEHFPEDGNRYELLDGMLLVTPSPGVPHQVVTNRLQYLLTAAVQQYAYVVGPGVVTLPPGTQLQPDILVYPATYAVDIKWQDVHEHWLAVEVLSRSSRVYDRDFKRDAYFALGVTEVWLVDLRYQRVEVSRQRGAGAFVHDTIRWSVPNHDLVVPVDLLEVFAGLGA